MRHPFPARPFAQTLGWLCLPLLFLAASLPAQNCLPIDNFEVVYYDHSSASYTWDFANDALKYELVIEINGKHYTTIPLPGTATTATVQFAPPLQNRDYVLATLVKHCNGGGIVKRAVDFLIIDDGIVYLQGKGEPAEGLLVEPVDTINDNLIPGFLCGRCEPEYFRLEAGFYGPMGIVLATAPPPVMEQVRFKKSELCNCLSQAVEKRILDPRGGPGENYRNGEPFNCQLTLYLFHKEDCQVPPPGGPNKTGPRSAAPAPARSLAVAPNPVSTSVQIAYHLPSDTRPILSLYNVAGTLVATLRDGQPENAGDHQLNFDAGTLAPGFYYWRLDNGLQVETKGMVVTR